VVHNEHFIFKSSFTYLEGSSAPSHLSKLIHSELSAYFNSLQNRFHLPLKPQGSAFQQTVWNALLVIPLGRTLTYGELAHQVQSSPRAVGQACKKNPLALFIPCHRVVGKDNLGGYMGDPERVRFKEALLQHEAFQLQGT
jgi:methylated-DNA-[protein]-cysteine S-methyltransferase